MIRKSNIRAYQQKCFREYAESVQLPNPYTFPDGNPIRPLPPIKTAVDGLMIIGAYPSARFEKRPSKTRNGVFRLIPIADNLQPFGYEQYFDGIQVRTLPSADGLEEYLLTPLGIDPEECWITDLVKVFLYKPDHVESCGDAIPDFEVPMLRKQFRKLGYRSLSWLREEWALCEPELIVTLGQEVAQVVSGKLSGSSDQLVQPRVTNCVEMGDHSVIHLPHPDACRRYEKWRLRMAESVSVIKDYLNETPMEAQEVS